MSEELVIDVDELLSVCKIWFDPRECGASDIEGMLQMGEQDWLTVTDGVKDENIKMVGVWEEEEVIGDFEVGCKLCLRC